MRCTTPVCTGTLFLAAFSLLAQEAPTGPPASVPREPGLYATIHVVLAGGEETETGIIVCRLFEKETPEAVANFTGLVEGSKEWTDPKTGEKVKRPLYAGTTFHRVLPGFMIQGGDPLGNGDGDIGYTFKDEILPELAFDVPGRLAMANSGPNTNANQFFLTETVLPHLNNLYTIFGQVVEGQDLIGDIARVPRDENDKPLKPVTITKITLRREGG